MRASTGGEQSRRLWRLAAGATGATLAVAGIGARHDAPTAERLYRRAIALDDTEGSYRAGLAAVLLDTNRRAEAVAQAQKAIALGYSGPDKTHLDPVFARLGLDPASPEPTPTPRPAISS